jgi:hypothetical protein
MNRQRPRPPPPAPRSIGRSLAWTPLLAAFTGTVFAQTLSPADEILVGLCGETTSGVSTKPFHVDVYLDGSTSMVLPKGCGRGERRIARPSDRSACDLKQLTEDACLGRPENPSDVSRQYCEQLAKIREVVETLEKSVQVDSSRDRRNGSVRKVYLWFGTSETSCDRLIELDKATLRPVAREGVDCSGCGFRATQDRFTPLAQCMERARTRKAPDRPGEKGDCPKACVATDDAPPEGVPLTQVFVTDGLVSRARKSAWRPTEQQFVVHLEALRSDGGETRAFDLTADQVYQHQTQEGTKGVPSLVDKVAPKKEVFPIGARIDLLLQEDSVLAVHAQAGLCSGVLVDPSVVLTAAHCTPAALVSLGDDANRSTKAIPVRRFEAHPTLDVALLALAEPVTAPIPPRRTDPTEPEPMGGLWAIGFGLSEAGAGKRRALTLTAEGWGCDGTRPRTTGCLPEGELVVPGHPGGDTCIGDSGGPLLEFFVSKRVCMPRLLGITSRRTANATSACGSGGIYTRADTIAGWIDEGVARLVSPSGSARRRTEAD